MIELAERQFELLESAAEDADGLLMGEYTPVAVRSFDPGEPATRDATSERPMADGIAFGRVPFHLLATLSALLCSNHVTYRFGKGMTPGRIVLT